MESNSNVWGGWVLMGFTINSSARYYSYTVVRFLCGDNSGTRSSSSLVSMMTTFETDGDELAVDVDDDWTAAAAAAAAATVVVESDSDCAFNCHLASWTG